MVVCPSGSKLKLELNLEEDDDDDVTSRKKKAQLFFSRLISCQFKQTICQASPTRPSCPFFFFYMLYERPGMMTVILLNKTDDEDEDMTSIAAALI